MKETAMFDPDRRDQVEQVLTDLAERDDRITAAAVVGSRALGPGDRYSDIDSPLTAGENHPMPPRRSSRSI